MNGSSKKKENAASIDTAAYVRNGRIKTMKQVLSLPENAQPWLVENWIPAGQLTALIAPSDVGKSIFCRQLVVCTVLKRKLFVEQGLNAKHGQAIYVSTEDMDYEWKQKMQNYPLDKHELKLIEENMLLITNFGDSSGDLVRLLDEELKQTPTDLVVLDVLTDVFTGDINNSISVRSFLKPFKDLAQKHGTAFLFVHHVSKRGEVSAQHSKQNVLGSQAIEASMRSVLELRKDPDNVDERVLKIIKGNYVPEVIKKQNIKLLLKPDLTYDRKIGFIESLKLNPALEERVLSLHNAGKSCRAITAILVNEGFKVGKTTVNEVIKKLKGGNSESPLAA